MKTTLVTIVATVLLNIFSYSVIAEETSICSNMENALSYYNKLDGKLSPDKVIILSKEEISIMEDYYMRRWDGAPFQPKDNSFGEYDTGILLVKNGDPYVVLETFKNGCSVNVGAIPKNLYFRLREIIPDPSINIK